MKCDNHEHCREVSNNCKEKDCFKLDTSIEKVTLNPINLEKESKRMIKENKTESFIVKTDSFKFRIFINEEKRITVGKMISSPRMCFCPEKVVKTKCVENDPFSIDKGTKIVIHKLLEISKSVSINTNKTILQEIHNCFKAINFGKKD
jgi:hypothetical protein